MNEKKKLQARDFITIGIFTAILWVVQMVIMYLGFLSPLIVAGYAVLIPIVTGIPMMLYYARIEKFGMLTITSVIVAILLFIFGMGLTGAPICIVAGLVADFIAKSGNYKSQKKTILSYAVFSLWVTASYLPLVITADSYKAIHSVFGQPAITLKHTLCEYHFHLINRMANAPNIRYILTACTFQKIFEINLVNHTLDIRHTDLVGMVNVFAAIDCINPRWSATKRIPIKSIKSARCFRLRKTSCMKTLYLLSFQRRNGSRYNLFLGRK